MKKSSFFKSLPFKLLVGVVIGILAGLALNANDGREVDKCNSEHYCNFEICSGTDYFILCSADHHWIYRTVHYKDGK